MASSKNSYTLTGKNCIIKGNRSEWCKLDSNKSLFTCGDEYGLPIGNLTSQMFANFYLHEFDYTMCIKFKGYGRYVDDFFIIDTKDKILNNIQNIETYLKTKRKVTLHPNKRYIQHYTKGCKFIGSNIKMNRIYSGNYTVGKFYDKIRWFNKQIKYNNNWIINNKDEFRSSINSYLGYLKHYKSYYKKVRIINMLDNEWLNYGYIEKNYNKIILY